MEPESKGGSDDSAENAGALGAWWCMQEAAAAVLVLFYGQWLGGIGTFAGEVFRVRAS